MVSSLEAMHDEIYFDTLDFLRGITRFGEGATPPPGGHVALVGSRERPPPHPPFQRRRESKGPRSRSRTGPALAPEMEVKWKEKDREEFVRKFAFPALKVEGPEGPRLHL